MVSNNTVASGLTDMADSEKAASQQDSAHDSSQSQDGENIPNTASDLDKKTFAHCSSGAKCKKSKFSPTVKGALIGAVAGSVLPVFGTFSGAVIGGIAGKVYEKKCRKNV